MVDHCSDKYVVTIFYISSFFLAAECGGNITSPTGIITTPYYPDIYPINADCTWIISPTEFGGVQLSFDYIYIQRGGDCGLTGCDYVLIRNGTDSNSPVIANSDYILDNMKDILTSSDGFHLYFKSNRAYSYFGFRFQYQPSAGKLLMNKDVYV